MIEFTFYYFILLFHVIRIPPSSSSLLSSSSGAVDGSSRDSACGSGMAPGGPATGIRKSVGSQIHVDHAFILARADVEKGVF